MTEWAGSGKNNLQHWHFPLRTVMTQRKVFDTTALGSGLGLSAARSALVHH
jgi:hypothetical protein